MEDLFGLAPVAALSTGVWGLFIVGIFALARSMVLARADQKRASNEGVAADSKSSQAQFERLEREIERLTGRVLALELAGTAKDVTIAELTAIKLQAAAERAAERVVHEAAITRRDVIIAHLRAQVGSGGEAVTLAEATEHVARETGRVADAAEKAVNNGD